MKPLRLELQAFGSFPGTEVVDFSLLAARGLFVVSGPTGAGKSTIFDAMTFALFGRVPGDRPDGEVRSHHGDAAGETYVEFEFEVERGRFRIRRSPSFERPKLRGEGTTTAPATAHLVEILPTGEHRPVSAKANECSRHCAELVGLSASEFQRVVLLPQGKFTSFLLASTDEREKLLRQLFGGELYDRATRHLQDHMKALRAEVAGSDDEIRHHLQNARTDVQAVRAAWTGADPLDEEAKPDAVAAALDALDDLVPARRAAVDVLRREAAHAADHWAVATSITAQWLARDELQRELIELESFRPQREVDQHRLDAARRARPVLDAHGALDDARTRAGSAAGEFGEAIDHARTLLRGLGCTDVAAGELSVASVAKAAASQAAALADRTRRVQSALAAAAAAADATSHADAAHARSRTARESLAAAELEAQVLAVRRSELEPIAAAVDRCESSVSAARERLALRVRLDARSAELVDAERLAADAHRQYVEVMARYVATQAPRLASTLHAGDPCPVCGSGEHPSPAVADEAEAVDHDAVDRARALQTDAASRLAALRESIAMLVADLGADGDAPVAALHDRVEHAEAELRSARAASDELVDLVRSLGEVERLVRTCRDEADDARDEATAAAASAEAAERRAREFAVAADGIDADQLAREAPAVTALERLAAELPAIQAALTSAETTAADAGALLDRVLAVSGFESISQAVAAAASVSDVDDLAAQLEQWRARLDSVTAQLGVFAGMSLPDERPDLDAAEARAHRTEQRYADARSELDTQLDGLERCRQALHTVEALGEGSRDLRDRYELARRVYATCNGETSSRVRLETWVLAHELERVAEMANVHLARMTGHRYRLQRVDGVAGRGRAGLDLMVLDAHTGRARATSTLSGGEQFQASLALALGLADVVSHGGVSSGRTFDALFVDEGFGSLDPDALEQAIAALQQLQASGRMVGVITHVEAMKQQLPVGIEVRRLPDSGGSTLVVS
jgi:DNA repair protein SbcC/Rad50